MVALFITINILELTKHKLNLNEYLTLLKFQHDAENKSFPFIPDENSILKLLERQMIIWDINEKRYVLRPEGIKVFKSDDDLFDEFYRIFPHKVPTEFGFRPVSTTDPEGVSAKVTRGIWERVIKNKPYLPEKIIANLKRELVHRQAENSLGYLQNIDTWLRQATWEKWEDIPNKKEANNNYTKL